jgi:hypothetical protein
VQQADPSTGEGGGDPGQGQEPGGDGHRDHQREGHRADPVVGASTAAILPRSEDVPVTPWYRALRTPTGGLFQRCTLDMSG